MHVLMTRNYADIRPPRKRNIQLNVDSRSGRPRKRQQAADPGYDPGSVREALRRALIYKDIRITRLEAEAGTKGSLRKFLQEREPAHSPGIDIFIKVARRTGLTVSQLIGETPLAPAIPPPAPAVEQLADMERQILALRRASLQGQTLLDDTLVEFARLLRLLKIPGP